MFGLTMLVTVLLVGGLTVVAYLVEVVLFWAAAALGDAPELGWGKTFLVSLIATVAWAGVGGGLIWSLGQGSLLAPDNRLLLVVVGLLAVLVTWIVPGVLYAPLVPVSVPRSMFISVVQVLLRIFLYVLIAAVVMVVLAVLQIVRGGDSRSELWAPALAQLAAFVLA
jgi:hypothetical protein